jgi:hypothetical protein
MPTINISDADLEKLASSVTSKILGTTKKRKSTYSESGSFDPDKLAAYIENTGNASKKLAEDLKKLSMAFKGGYDMYTKLEKATRDQEGYVREMNKTLVDHIKSTKDSITAIRELKQISGQAREALNGYSDNLKKYNIWVQKTNEIESQRNKIQKSLLEAEAELAKARKNKKSTKDAKAKVAAIAAEELRTRKAFNIALDEAKTRSQEAANELRAYAATLREQNKYTKHLTEDELKLLENFDSLNEESEEYVKTMKKANDSTDAFDRGLNTVADSMKEAADKMEKAFDGLKASIGKAALELLTKSPAVAFKDFLNQLKYNVNESDYSNDWKMGMSESERAQVIGENRIGLRVLGGGDEQAGLRTGGSQIQKAAWQYGVQGADAERLGLEYQNRLINQGYGGSAKDTADQMTVMHNLAKDLGLTDDQLKHFYDSLQDMGEMAQMQQKYANLSQEEQRKAINKEIQARLALNNQLGISIERETQLNQEAINKKYGGIAQSIMSNIGASQEISQYNADNPNSQITGKQAAAYQQMKARGWDTLTTEQKKDATEAQHSISANRNSQLNKAAQQGQSQFNAAEVKYVDSMKPLVPGMQQDDIEALKETQREKSLQGTQVNENTSYSDLQKNIIDTTNNAFIPFNKEVLEATQRLQGLGKNPLGAPAETLGNGLANFAGSFLGSSLGTRGVGGMARGAGGLLRGAGGYIAETATTGVGELAAGGIAGIVPIVAGVLGAAAVGVAIGALINHFLQGTKLGDAIGSGEAHIMAAFGSKDAKEAIANNAAADKANAATDARMSAINAVTKAEHAAVNARGTANEGALRQQAEALRTGYRQQYGVDLTGAGFGYDTSKSTSLSNATKFDDDVANQANQGTDAASKAQIEQLQKMVKIMQDQLDLAKKADQKSDQADTTKQSTWDYYKQHIEDVRKGLG